ncbi:MAG: HupE/UreJ family protein [Myxococcota bacterium]|nr:HupE/UreJ family protein [Myxococcota bacterium]
MIRLLLLFAALLFARTGLCHEATSGALALEETAPGRFLIRWTAPAKGVDPEFPEHCALLEGAIDCGSEGLTSIDFEGLEGSTHRIVVRVQWAAGKELTQVASAEHARLELRGGTDVAETIREFVRLGIEHILGGVDHLLFVLALVLLVRDGKRLVATVTAFTLAHSVTLAGAVLGWVRVPSAPVEAVIALSILLVAVECAKPVDSWSRRAPWAVAFGFGLLHGFGFAGALAEVGLPPQQVPLALGAFNAGVELGQLLVVAPAWLALRSATRWARAATVERALVYAIGSAASCWAIERVWAVFA